MATWQVRPEQVANSTLASLCPGSVSPLANSTQNGLVIECPTRVSGELPRNSRATLPKADFHRKKDEGWDLWVTSATLLWVGGFGGELGQCYSLAGTEQGPPPTKRTGSESLITLPWGQGRPSLPSGSDRQPLEPEFFLEGVQLVQSWLGPGDFVGEKGSY